MGGGLAFAAFGFVAAPTSGVSVFLYFPSAEGSYLRDSSVVKLLLLVERLQNRLLEQIAELAAADHFAHGVAELAVESAEDCRRAVLHVDVRVLEALDDMADEWIREDSSRTREGASD